MAGVDKNIDGLGSETQGRRESGPNLRVLIRQHLPLLAPIVGGDLAHALWDYRQALDSPVAPRDMDEQRIKLFHALNKAPAEEIHKHKEQITALFARELDQLAKEIAQKHENFIASFKSDSRDDYISTKDLSWAKSIFEVTRKLQIFFPAQMVAIRREITAFVSDQDDIFLEHAKKLGERYEFSYRTSNRHDYPANYLEKLRKHSPSHQRMLEYATFFGVNTSFLQVNGEAYVKSRVITEYPALLEALQKGIDDKSTYDFRFFKQQYEQVAAYLSDAIKLNAPITEGLRLYQEYKKKRVSVFEDHYLDSFRKESVAKLSGMKRLVHTQSNLDNLLWLKETFPEEFDAAAFEARKPDIEQTVSEDLGVLIRGVFKKFSAVPNLKDMNFGSIQIYAGEARFYKRVAAEHALHLEFPERFNEFMNLVDLLSVKDAINGEAMNTLPHASPELQKIHEEYDQRFSLAHDNELSSEEAFGA